MWSLEDVQLVRGRKVGFPENTSFRPTLRLEFEDDERLCCEAVETEVVVDMESERRLVERDIVLTRGNTWKTENRMDVS